VTFGFSVRTAQTYADWPLRWPAYVAPEVEGVTWIEAVAYATERVAIEGGDLIVGGDRGPTPGCPPR
jgi:hypothetical protein